MTCIPEHVATWMIGIQFQKQLDPLQNLVFQLFICAPVPNSPICAFQHALDVFRNAHFNKYLYELQTPNAMEVAFIERLKKLDSIKKPTKKDYVTLFKDLQSFKSCMWPGGHHNGESVLKGWHPDLRKCKAMYPVWYADEVKQVRSQFNLTEHKCALAQRRYLWTTYKGTTCPANIQVFSEAYSDHERVQAYKKACQPYVLQINPNILHVSESFYQMYTEMANSNEKDAKLHLQELYTSRTPMGYDLVAHKHSLQEQVKRLCIEKEHLQLELKEKIEQNRHLNMLSQEYDRSLEAMSKQITEIDYTCSGYKQALYERDITIQQLHQQLQQQRTNMYYNTFH